MEVNIRMPVYGIDCKGVCILTNYDILVDVFVLLELFAYAACAQRRSLIVLLLAEINRNFIHLSGRIYF